MMLLIVTYCVCGGMFDVEKWMEVVPLVEWTAVAVDALWSGVCEARQEAICTSV